MSARGATGDRRHRHGRGRGRRRRLGRPAARAQTATAQRLVDGSDPNVALTALFVGGLVGQAQSAQAVAALAARMGQGAVAGGGIDLRPVALYNPQELNVAFMVPGLIGMLLQMQAILLTAAAIVRERERGTMEQLVVGKVVPHVAVAFVAIAASPPPTTSTRRSTPAAWA